MTWMPSSIWDITVLHFPAWFMPSKQHSPHSMNGRWGAYIIGANRVGKYSLTLHSYISIMDNIQVNNLKSIAIGLLYTLTEFDMFTTLIPGGDTWNSNPMDCRTLYLQQQQYVTINTISIVGNLTGKWCTAGCKDTLINVTYNFCSDKFLTPRVILLETVPITDWLKQQINTEEYNSTLIFFKWIHKLKVH